MTVIIFLLIRPIIPMRFKLVLHQSPVNPFGKCSTFLIYQKRAWLQTEIQLTND